MIEQFATYTILDTINIANYLAYIEFEDFNKNEKFSIQDIGDGNLNNVFRIIQHNHSFIVKQALPYLKIVGPEHSLSFDRVDFEIEYYKSVAKYITCGLPKIYYSDSELMKLIIMQDLNNHQVMRQGLIEQTNYPLFAEQIGSFLATTTFYTSRCYLTQLEHDALKLSFQHNFLCKLTDEFIFTFPYFAHNSNNPQLNFKPIFSKQFICNAYQLRHKFRTANESLVHGDLHTGSIMLNQNEMFIIDPEFAFIGPSGFDLGILIANLITAIVANLDKLKYVDSLKDMILKIWESFSQNFTLLWNNNLDGIEKDHLNNNLSAVQNSYLHTLLNDMLGFAGMEICRRICGIAGVKEIRGVIDTLTRNKLEILALTIGQKLVEGYGNYTNIYLVLNKIIEENKSL